SRGNMSGGRRRRDRSGDQARQFAAARSSGVDVLEEVEQEGAVLKFRVGDVQTRLVGEATVVAKDVAVDLARSPALAVGPAELALDPLDGVQQGSRLERGLDLEHLVQKLRLVTNADRLGLGHPRATHHGDAHHRQCLARRLEISGAVAEVAAEGQPHAGHVCTMASAIRATRTIDLTSCTRTMSAPPAMLSAIAAAVPSSRSPTGRASVLPMNDLRDGPISRGKPSRRRSGRRLMISRFSSRVFPNPMPGSTMMRSSGIPAARPNSALSRRAVAISPIRSRDRKSNTSELQSLAYLVCRLLLEKKNHTILLIYVTR